MLEKLFQTANKRDLNEAELTQMEDWLASNPVERAELEAVDRGGAEVPEVELQLEVVLLFKKS